MSETRTPLTPADAKRAAARCFDDACSATRWSSGALADHMMIDEKTVRSMRLGVRPVTAERILQLPATLRADYLRRLAEHAPAPLAPATPEDAARGGQRGANDLLRDLIDALDPASPGGAKLSLCERRKIRVGHARLTRVLAPILTEEEPS